MEEMSGLIVMEVDTPLGKMLAASTNEGICLLEFCDQEERATREVARLEGKLKCKVQPGKSTLLAQLEKELGEYFNGRRKVFEVALNLLGTPFQQSVWQTVRQVPFGETRTYEHIAAVVGRPAAIRAVGAANGSNPVSIVIPCHRLINKQGGLSGYGGGLWRKEWLLKLERG